MRDGDSVAVAKQEASVKMPTVEKRGAIDPFHKARNAAAAERAQDRLKDAAPGSRICPYCKKWMPKWYPENCPSMPYEYWRHKCKGIG